MKKESRFFLNIIILLFILVLISSIWGIAERWKLYAWIGIGISLPFALLPFLAQYPYSIWQFYVRITSEGMRFFQGTGLVLFTIGYYLLRYIVLDADVARFYGLLEGLHISFTPTELNNWPSGGWRYWSGLGLFFFVSGLIPPLANLLFKLWMGFAGILQAISSRIILTLVYILAVLPVGLIAKLTGKKFLDKSWQPDSSESYWIDRDYQFKATNYKRHF